MDHSDIPVIVYPTSSEASVVVAKEVARCVQEKAGQGQVCVLGLATGSTPKGVYKELVSMHKAGQLSFSNVVTFNLDEYYPMQPSNEQSYWWFMHQQLFNHVDIPKENVHIPSGAVSKSEISRYCADYEAAIAAAGGIDLQLLGIGRNGHIGFNESGSDKSTLTRYVQLAASTREDAAADFGGLENVPEAAVTMGVATIMAARHVILMAWSQKKAPTVAAAVEGPICADVPASFLRQHPNAVFYLDQPAASKLRAQQTVASAGAASLPRASAARQPKALYFHQRRFQCSPLCRPSHMHMLQLQFRVY